MAVESWRNISVMTGHRIQKFQVCDATDDATYAKAGLIKVPENQKILNP